MHPCSGREPHSARGDRRTLTTGVHSPAIWMMANSRSTIAPLSERFAPSRSDEKNYLFAGSDAGGESAAAIYSLVGTAKLNGLNPEHYLREVLGRIADHPIAHIDQLLPWNLAASLHADSTTDALTSSSPRLKLSGHLKGSTKADLSGVKRGTPHAYSINPKTQRSSMQQSPFLSWLP